ncbi:cation:proton antiporter subunit C [Microbulbifer hydrolyticus]|uniref:Multicomponent Na+:H+ antiporter subunit C n=1 Tax=Microbulbifer hydrolyticus TaxID=48074 RepID=A0A6P1T5Z6_9GAMM|nr:cation:proton antiporter subunit C [Microbulbifer hydrolyticus]MBB5211025.1 multicomponent Na+:H+ antiporter subunit C [Microbulbifer hydrolyticus]QHQ38168.1 Na+/H+ antiporter subunit C [Microbulbifer hydrolyticus]
MLLASHYNYWIVIALMMIGLYMVIAQGNLVKKIIGLNIFQTSVFIFYISVGKVDGGNAPILSDSDSLYSNPLPHVLILTAIVVGIATTALALALAIRIKRAYGSIEERDIQAAEDLQERTLTQPPAGKEQ